MNNDWHKNCQDLIKRLPSIASLRTSISLPQSCPLLKIKNGRNFPTVCQWLKQILRLFHRRFFVSLALLVLLFCEAAFQTFNLQWIYRTVNKIVRIFIFLVVRFPVFVVEFIFVCCLLKAEHFYWLSLFFSSSLAEILLWWHWFPVVKWMIFAYIIPFSVLGFVFRSPSCLVISTIRKQL